MTSPAHERTEVIEHAQRALATGDWEGAVDGARHLIATAERRPQDEPSMPDGPAHDALLLATELAERNPENGAVRSAADSLRANALRLLGRAHDAEAREAFEAALARSPSSGALWFDAGLLHKWRGRWREALECTERAEAALGATRAVLWNIAIAATALGDARRAADAWRRLGFDVREGQHLVEVPGIPPARLRVPSVGDGHAGSPVDDRAARFELPWVEPLSPCHGVIVTPTFGRAPVDVGDVVLWDGAPAAVVEEGGTTVPRFVLLEVLSRGAARSFRFLLRGDVGTLAKALPPTAEIFVQAPTLEVVSLRGADGSTIEREDTAQASPIHRGKIVARPDADLLEIDRALAQFAETAGATVAAPDLVEAIGDTRRAGKAHQTWKGLESVAKRTANRAATPE
ncbi:MAG: hypothetical protein R3A78_14865 [Polyangiales bacterium]|nr:hypothetical protein [Myxococcales bacterium]